MPHEFVRPFHFWCQKVLPLVFDDSLSYYEVLAKMRDYLNEAIKEINEIGSEFEGVKTQLTQLKTYVDEYFAGLDVNQAISDKLDDMVESGEMDAVITPIFAAYANPVFVASIADMIATNFAYANYENNKIYTFNQSTGLYETTGKEFGGVVSSVDEMVDNDKYYALDSDGMLYSYDYPQGVFVASGLTYGGYRYGVNAMRPLSNIYVLTTNNHVYNWNGSEYVDTGVVYGVSNMSFLWRKELTSSDNLVALPLDGYYSIDLENPPTGMPENYSPVNPFVECFTVNGEKRVVIHDENCVLLYCGEWHNLSVSGYNETTDCNNAPKNSFTIVTNADNSPTNESGNLITLETAQLFVSASGLYVRTIGEEWIELCAQSDFNALRSFVIVYSQEYEQFKNAQRQINNEIIEYVDSIERHLDFYIERFTETSESLIISENAMTITSENGKQIKANVVVLKTDKTLSVKNAPADSAKVGEITASLIEAISYNNALIEVSGKEFNAKLDEISAKVSVYDNLLSAKMKSIATTNSLNIATENNATVIALINSINTDVSLTLSDIPADSKATGEVLERITETVNKNANKAQKDNDETQAKLDSILRGIAISSIENITAENGNVIMQEGLSVLVDPTLSENGVPANAKSVGEALGELKSVVFTIKARTITTQNNSPITCENGIGIAGGYKTVNTDDTLSIQHVPADAYATGKAIDRISERADAYSRINGIESYTIPIIRLYGELPTTKSNVNMTAKMFDKFTVPVRAKVQGSSSLSNPEKNYTLTFEDDITFMGFTTNKWNIKCNFIDPTQMRNIICARLWKNCVDVIYPYIEGDISNNSGVSIAQENGNTLAGEKPNIRIQQSPYCGASQGDTVILYVNDEFHGIYTMQLPKGKYMWGMRGSSNQFACSINYWNWTPISASQITSDGPIELEENTDDMTEDIIAEKLNAIIECINSDNFAQNIGNYVDINLWICYICFSLFCYHFDGITRNQILYSFNGGNKINPSVWDLDCTFGNSWTAIRAVPPDGNFSAWTNNKLFNAIFTNMPEQVKSIWNTLKTSALNMANIWNHVNNFSIHTNERLYQMDFKKWAMKGKTYLYSPSLIIEWCRDNLEKADSFIQNL